MSQDLLGRAKAAVKSAQALGAQGARVTVRRARDSSLEWRDGKLDRIRESTRMSLALALYVDGRYSESRTSDLRDQPLQHFIEECVAMTRVLAKDPARGLPEQERYADRISTDMQLFDPEGARVTPEQRRKDAAEMEAAARAEPGADRLVSVTTSCEDELQEVALVASNDMEGFEERSAFSLVCMVNLRGEGQRKQPAWWYSSQRCRAKLPSVRSIANEAMQRGFMAIGSRPEKTGLYPCVVENVVAGKLIGSLLSPLDGFMLQQKRSFLAGKLDQQIGSPLLDLADAPHLPAGLGSASFDSEGMATRPRPIFEKGKLRTFFLDTYYARKLKREPTTGARSNVVFQPGERDLKGLLAQMGTGLLINGFLGGNANPATGDFSFGIRGLWVEQGRIVRPVSEMNLSGSHLEFWKRLVELGCDPWSSSAMRTPSLRFDEVQFSGV